jgi:hypothetical protein
VHQPPQGHAGPSFLGYIEAPDEKAAIEAAAKEYKITVVARRDGL